MGFYIQFSFDYFQKKNYFTKKYIVLYFDFKKKRKRVLRKHTNSI